MTIYEGHVITQNEELEVGAMIMIAFGDMKVEKVKMITDMMRDEGYTKQKAIDSVKTVIKEHRAWGHEPNIGNFFGYLGSIKILTYAEITSGADQGKLSWDDYQPVNVGLDKPRWARIEDVRKHQIKQWQQP